MNDLILILISIGILLLSLYFNLSLKISFILYGLNLLGIFMSFAYYSIQPIVGITSAPPEVFGLLNTYKAMLALIICVGIIVIKKYYNLKRKNLNSSSS